LEGFLEPTDEVLVLARVGDEDVGHGHYSPGRLISCLTNPSETEVASDRSVA
jgi:hypothetical protein